MQVLKFFKQRWSEPCGYREVCNIALPLVLSTSSWTIQSFVDRMFLTWYSPETLAASTPASIISFTVLSFFIGTASFVSTFVAQYFGANRPERIGPSVWQGIYFSLTTFFLFIALVPASGFIFNLVGHNEQLKILETQYFQVLCYGEGFAIYSAVISAFFSGLGHTWTLMWVNILITIINIVFDYCMIFGYGGFPELGIIGAGWATVISQISGAILFSILLFGNSEYRKKFAIVSGWKIDYSLLKRLLLFGSPNGVQYFLDGLAFTFYIILVGRLGTDELTVTTLAFHINTIAFLPMIGFSIATTTLVGQSLGRDQPNLASRATWNSFHLTFVYMGTIAVLYVVTPNIFLLPFATNVDPIVFEKLRPVTITLLKFIAVYSIFDTCNVIFSGTLKGAGDTKFVMYFSLICGWLVLVLPTYFITKTSNKNFLLTWVFVTLYVSLVGLGFLIRFLQGKWKNMRVIEQTIVSY